MVRELEEIWINVKKKMKKSSKDKGTRRDEKMEKKT